MWFIQASKRGQRQRPLANAAMWAGADQPSSTTGRMARPDTPRISDSSAAIVPIAYANTPGTRLPSRIRSRLRRRAVARQLPLIARFRCEITLAYSHPERSRVANHWAGVRSVYCPGTLFTWQWLRRSSYPLQNWEYKGASLETELSLEVVDAEVQIMSFPLQHAKGDKAAGHVMLSGPVR